MAKKNKLILTGGSGFIGSQLLDSLVENNEDVSVVVRRKLKINKSVEQIEVAEIDSNTNWCRAVRGCDVFIHCAARAHVMKTENVDPLTAYRKVNVDGTLNLARQAAVSGVKRFVYLSSIKVNGEETVRGQKFCATDIHDPEDFYGISKSEAEKKLFLLGQETSMEIVVIRPPLVYGPGVKGNFLSMLSWLHKGVPLPLGAINNKRSFVGLTNLVDLIVRCVKHPAAKNKVFIAGDGEDVSTTELLEKISFALGKKSRLFPVSPTLLTLVAMVLNKRSVTRKLCGSLQIDISDTQDVLNWTPPMGMRDELRRTVDHYLEHLKK